jgi:hypothetical protein
LGVGLEALNNSKRGDDEVEFLAQVEITNVRLGDPDPIPVQSGHMELRSADLQHRHGAIETVQERAALSDGDRDTPGPATQLQDSRVRRGDAIEEERDILREVRVEVVELRLALSDVS